MISCDNAALEQWNPDFSSSEQPDPTWTRVICGGALLCNSLEWTQWLENPVQVILCTACGYAGCETGGYVHVSRLGDHVVWTRPRINESDTRTSDQYEPAWPLRRFGAVVVPLDTWAQWRKVVATLPPADRFGIASGRELIDAWLLGARGIHQAISPDNLISSLQGRVLASDSFEADTTIGHVEEVLVELSAERETPLRGQITRVADVGARVEVLYFDGPGAEEWPALAVIGSKVVPAFSREWVFVRDRR